MLEEARNNDEMMDWVGRKHSYKFCSVSLLGSPIFDPILSSILLREFSHHRATPDSVASVASSGPMDRCFSF